VTWNSQSSLSALTSERIGFSAAGTYTLSTLICEAWHAWSVRHRFALNDAPTTAATANATATTRIKSTAVVRHQGAPTAVVRHHATQIQRARATANTETIVSQAHTGIVNDFHQFDGYAEEYGLTNSRTDPEDTDIKIIDLDEMVKTPERNLPVIANQ